MVGGVPGIIVENKSLTASIHVRQVRQEHRSEVRTAVEAVVHSQSERFFLTTGSEVLEIRPAVAWNKGSAAAWIRERFAPNAEVTFVLGDDCTDEDAFKALPDAVTVRIGPAVPTAARYSLASPAEVAELFSRLVEATPVNARC
jgi:trehalose-phosphatase